MSSRLELALASVLERLMPRVDFYALYPCTMKAQNADLTLELVPDNPKLGAHSKVKIRTGVPNMQVKVVANARVLLGFEEGNPGRPYASLWESASVTELVLNGTTIKLTGTTINLGDTPIDAALKGTTYRTAETTSNASLSAAITAMNAGLVALGAMTVGIAAVPPISVAAAAPPLLPLITAAAAGITAATAAATAATAGISTFEGGAASYLSQVVKVK